MMLAFWPVFAEHVIADTPTELVGIVSIIALLVGAYRKIECHQTGCHRFGRFEHGHFKLCRVHHPNVPSSGKVTADHIRHQTHDGKPKKRAANA